MFPAKERNSQKAFTLVELLIYIGIFSVVAGLVLGILNSTIKSNQAEVANNEVTTQLNTVLTDIQNQVNQSSNVGVYPDLSTLDTPTSTGSLLKLRMNSSSTDPTCIYLASSTVYMAQGPDPSNASQCNQSSATALTTSQVLANNLTFTQITVPGGYASVSVSLQLTYNSSNPAFAISKTVQSAISRVSSATFSSNLIPASDNTFDIGQISPNLRWRNANFAGTITLGTGSSGGSLGIGTETPSGVLDVVASSTNSLVVASNGNVGIGTTGPYAPLNISSNVDNSASWWNIGDVGLVVANSNANGDAILKLENTVGRIVWGSGLSSDLLVFSSIYATSTTSSEVVVNDTGNVGIGTSNPAYKLDVSGDIRATGNYYNGGTQLAYPISLPETGSSAQWVKLGTLTIPQQGRSAFITIISNEGFNASIGQNLEVYIRFKTSNSNSVDANGFCADSSYYVLGENSLFLNSGNIKWVANASGCSATAYTLYMNFGTWTGAGSFYTVQSSQGTWVNSGALGQTDPGAASATVEIPINQMSIQSNVGIGTTASTNTSTPLVVNGIIYSKSGGIEFPDGTIQTSAYVAPPPNPSPTISSISPTSTAAGGSNFTLTVTGTNFVSNSVVNINGSPRTTSFVSSTQLTATILSSDIASSGTSSITVTNPTPGGGTSNSLTLTITSAPLTFAAAGTTFSASSGSVTIPSGYSLYICTSGSWPPDSITMSGTTIDEAYTSNYAVVGHQTSNVCSATYSGSGAQAIAGIGVSTSAYSVLAKGTAAVSTTATTYNYTVTTPGLVVIVLSSGDWVTTNVTIPSGCTQQVFDASSGSYGTSYIATCPNQAAGSYSFTSTGASSNTYTAWAVYEF